MQTLGQNKQTVYYAKYLGATDKLVNSKKTGEKVKSYAYPVEIRANVSPAKNDVSVEPFGIHTDYEKAMVVSNAVTLLEAEDVLWVGKDITESNTRITVSVSGTSASGKTFIYDGSGWTLNGTTVSLATYGITVSGTLKVHDSIVVSGTTAAKYQLTAHNYRITKVAQSINSVYYGLKEVN